MGIGSVCTGARCIVDGHLRHLGSLERKLKSVNRVDLVGASDLVLVAGRNVKRVMGRVGMKTMVSYSNKPT